jgi:hypothetical protein
MNLEESVFKISEDILNDPPLNVLIDEPIIDNLVKEMKKEGKLSFPMPDIDDELKDILVELIASSINYCYWYSGPTIRPNNSSSGLMYKLVQESLQDIYLIGISKSIDLLIKKLAIYRFPLLEQRKNHLLELVPKAVSFCSGINKGNKKDHREHFQKLIETFPGFAADIFLKRASLFFLQLNRKFGWFSDSINYLPVPADYQVPKILHHYGCIQYRDSLLEKINNKILIPKHSKEECQIRAATVLVCKELSKRTEWNTSDIDGWLWLQREIASTPFHLTITTDY